MKEHITSLSHLVIIRFLPGHITFAADNNNTEGGMRHTSTALYFYGASKKSLHKPRAI